MYTWLCGVKVEVCKHYNYVCYFIMLYDHQVQSYSERGVFAQPVAGV